MVFTKEESATESLPHEVFWAHNGRRSDRRGLRPKIPGFCGLLAWGLPDSELTEGDMVFDYGEVVYQLMGVFNTFLNSIDYFINYKPMF